MMKLPVLKVKKLGLSSLTAVFLLVPKWSLELGSNESRDFLMDSLANSKVDSVAVETCKNAMELPTVLSSDVKMCHAEAGGSEFFA